MHENNNRPSFFISHLFSAQVAWIASVALFYFATARLSLSLVFQPEGIAAIWPPSGIFLSAILLTRHSARPYLVAVLLITDFIAELLAGTPLLVSAVYALELSSDAVLGSWLLIRLAGEPITFRKVRDVFLFLVLAIILSNGLLSLVAAAASTLVPGTSFWTSWKWWAASTGIGNLLVTPFIISWASWAKTRLETWNPQRAGELVALFVLLALVNLISFSYLSSSDLFSLFLPYLSLPFLLWAALRFEMRGVTSALFIIVAIAIPFVVAGRVAVFHESQLGTVVVLQLYLAIMAIPSLFLAAIVTEREHAAKERNERQQFIESLINLSPDIIYIYDIIDRKNVYTNDGMGKILGYSVSEIQEMDNQLLPILLHPEDFKTYLEETYPKYAKVKDDDHIIHQYRMKQKNGSWCWLDCNEIIYLREPNGAPRQIFGVVHDITERKRNEQTLRESEQRYHDLFDQANEGLFIMTLEGILFDVNQAFAEMHGYTVDELKRMDIRKLDVLKDGSLEDRADIIRRIQAGETVRFEVEHYHKDGHIFPLSVTTSIIQLGGQMYYLAFHQDITERRRNEELLHEKEYLLSETQKIAHVGSWTMALDSMKTQLSDETYRIFGVTPACFIPSPESFLGLIHRDDRPGMEKWIQDCIAGMNPSEMDFRIILPDGTVRFLCGHGYRQCAPDGAPRHLVGSVQDITDRKRAEEERRNLEERLQRSEKMEALGTLAGGVAHDLNNVLGIIVGYSEMVLESVDKSSPHRRSIENIMNGSLKAAAIVEDLLTLARRGVQGRSVLNLNRIIADFQKSPEFANLSSHHPSVKIQIDLEQDLLNISGSSVHIGKTLYNLVSNASEAMTRGGIVAIKTTNQYLDVPIQGYDQIRQGDYVVLSVSDTGEGISANDLKRIFEPFYTKKIMGRTGTGLGLAVVWGTVKDHNGYINVQSEEGKGSAFTLYFPVTREEITTEAPAVANSEYMGKGETILVVDDVKEQRDLAASILKTLHYNVTTVSSGEEAVAYLREHEVDLMVLDMIMDPGMDGLDSYKSILNICPNQKAIIVSGFSESDRVKEAIRLGVGAYVRKPYIKEKLGVAVRKGLDRK